MYRFDLEKASIGEKNELVGVFFVPEVTAKNEKEAMLTASCSEHRMVYACASNVAFLLVP